MIEGVKFSLSILIELFSTVVINKFNGIVLQDYNLSLSNYNFSNFIKYYLDIRGTFISNIKLTNHIFEPNRLSSDLYLSIKRIE